MNVLVTGSKGFIGKNLVQILKQSSYVTTVLEYDRENTFDELKNYCELCDSVFHLAAVLRPEDLSGFEDNIDLTSRLLQYLKNANNKCPVMFASSIQADLDNPYGRCKRIEESRIIEYGKENNINAFVFRFPNLFGTMCRPNYTSVVATFCYNAVIGIPITVNNPAAQMRFAFIDTVLESILDTVIGNKSELANKINVLEHYYPVGLGELVYYMETLKLEIEPKIYRDDDFYEKLQYTYKWFEMNHEQFAEKD